MKSNEKLTAKEFTLLNSVNKRLREVLIKKYKGEKFTLKQWKNKIG